MKKYCIYCNNELVSKGQKKFCSRVCSNKYNADKLSEQRIGNKYYTFKTGRYVGFGKCVDCGIKVKYKFTKRCHGCYLKWLNSGISDKGHFKKEKEHWNYKDGIQRRVDDFEWIKIARQVRKRDNYICQNCGKENSRSVHHKIPYRICLEDKMNNLVTLCRRCHGIIEAILSKGVKC